MSLRTVVAKDYKSITIKVRELDAEAKGKKLPLVVIIKSAPEPDGSCWCRDCGILDKMLQAKLDSMKLTGILLKAVAGTLAQWQEPNNPFKTDTTLDLAQIPTAFRWRDGKPLKKMEAPDLINPEKFKSLFAS